MGQQFTDEKIEEEDRKKKSGERRDDHLKAIGHSASLTYRPPQGEYWCERQR